jgi:hypothetical protein
MARSGKRCAATVGLLALFLITNPAVATERGGSIYPQGPENFQAGILPPPGTYLTNYLNYYTADRFNDRNGGSTIPRFRLWAVAETLRLTHVTPIKLFGANYAFQTLIPFVHLDVEAGERLQSRSGIGDITLTPIILGWHAESLHWAVGADVNLPIGPYDKDDLANIGRNHVNIEPVFAISYYAPNGPELSAKFMYDFNFENPATNYRSGQEFHFDYYAGWSLGRWSLGLNGYFYQQVTDDEVEDIRVAPDGNRGRVLAVGPALRYKLGGASLVLSWQHETLARNRPEGDKLWLKLIFAF